jgi:ABC-2 type transport system ATP-binding protein
VNTSLSRNPFTYRGNTFDSPIDAREFTSIPGVSELAVAGRGVSFKASGPLDRIVKAAARHTVIDMELTEPTLEEIFLTFYGRDGGP